MADFNHITRLRINSDGNGVRSVVFVQHCPLDCFWCCNPETHFDSNYKTLTTKQLYEYVKRDMPYFLSSNGGITFSGGEPLLYASFMEKFITEYCTNISVNIETSLYASQEDILRLIPLIDVWLIDFKVDDAKEHISFTGKSNDIIKTNLTLLASNIDPSKIIITYPMITGFNTSKDNVLGMIGFLKELGLQKIKLHPYRVESETKKRQMSLSYQSVPSLSPELFGEIKDMFQDHGFSVVDGEIVVGKGKCNFLKRIRKQVCKENDIPLEISNCTFEGECTGTCPQCEYELDMINQFQGDKSKQLS